METYQKSGYLNSEFKLFYLKDNNMKEFSYHYHDFHKLLIFLDGSVNYSIEGKDYELLPGDVLLIPAGEIHRPQVRGTLPYQRIIIYISQDFFDFYQKEGCDLFYCYRQTRNHHSNLIRLSRQAAEHLQPVVKELAASFRDQSFGTPLYQKAKLIEYLILLNRDILNETDIYIPARTSNPVILEIIGFINQHITEDLSIGRIADHMFLNRSYLMHLFKAETGYTIGKYITEKRLFLANHHISQGIPATEACYASGFRNYSAFYQAYKKKYQASPRNYVN